MQRKPILINEVKAEQPAPMPKKLGTIKPHKGHTLFEVDLAESVIRKATIRKVDADFPLKPGETIVLNKAVVVKPGCVYVSALNMQNAKKKVIKQLYAARKK